MAQTASISDETARLATVHSNVLGNFQEAAQVMQRHPRLATQLRLLDRVRTCVLNWPSSWSRVPQEVEHAFVTSSERVTASIEVLRKMKKPLDDMADEATKLETRQTDVEVAKIEARLHEILNGLDDLVPQLIDTFPQARDAQGQHINSNLDQVPEQERRFTLGFESGRFTDDPEELPERAAPPRRHTTRVDSAFGTIPGTPVRPLKRQDTSNKHIMRDIVVDGSIFRGGDWIGDSRNMTPQILRAAKPNLYEGMTITNSSVRLGDEYH